MSDLLQDAELRRAADVRGPDHLAIPDSVDLTHIAVLRHRIRVVVAAAIPATLYMIYVSHYAVNVPLADDWNMIPLAAAARHHHLSMTVLWSQYADTRLPLARLFFVAFSVFDHLNERSIILFSGGIFIVSYVILLSIFRSYLGRPLTFLRVFSLGIVWLSLADVQNALWSFQLAWYLVVLFFVTMAYFLLVPRHHKNVVFALAIAAGIAASLSEIQGFAAWPVGLICLLWASPWTRRTYYEIAIWVSAAVVTSLIYFHGFIFGSNSCLIEGGRLGGCSLHSALLHPVPLARFFAVLVGNVVPGTNWAPLSARDLVPYELLGTVICVTAGFVVVQSIREPRQRANPLPLVLIVFALLFDLMIATSHLGQGPLAAGANRFTMPNLILLAGIVVYGWAHVPNLRTVRERIYRGGRLRILGLAALTVFLVFQCVVATRFGITNGSTTKDDNATTARIVVNLDRLSSGQGACDFESVVVGPPLFSLLAIRDLALRNHLTVFKLDTSRLYRTGRPPVLTQCKRNVNPTTSWLPEGEIGVRYSATLTSIGGRPPYVWSVAPGFGLLPKGITLDASTGVISGTPRVGGSYWFSVTVSELHKGPIRTPSQASYPHALVLTIT